MQFNKSLKILTENYKLVEQLEKDSEGVEQKKIKLKGMALTLGKPTRNGVIYSLKDDSILKSMERKSFLDTHNDNSCLNTFGHVDKFWREGNNLMYEVDIDPAEEAFVRKARRGDVNGVSVQVLCDTAEEAPDGNIHANIESFLELSAVTIPGEGDSTATLLEAFGKKNPKAILKSNQGVNMAKEQLEPEFENEPEERQPEIKEEEVKDPTPGFSMTKCIKKMAPHMETPAAFCRWASDKGLAKYGEQLDDDSQRDMDEFYDDYGKYEVEKCGRKEDLSTSNGDALIATELPKEKEERVYDPAKKKMDDLNYEKEPELQDALDDIQDTGKKAEPEDERNLIPKAKKAQKEIYKRLTEMNTRVKKIDIKKRIEKLDKKLEGIKNAKAKRK